MSDYKSNKFKIHATTWNETFDLPDRNYLIVTYKIILNISSKNMQLLQMKILL